MIKSKINVSLCNFIKKAHEKCKSAWNVIKSESNFSKVMIEKNIESKAFNEFFIKSASAIKNQVGTTT